ncbi:hypothetical protein FD754_006023 [Muntiacus muntjak]|uniref:Uncharacterized protein n=1 Tax=Muntiacus muntjak TaxID=9888 RepID=A0A5N3WLQ5_MUNMU|nr:hypothetical protein FD754_006023 [Muntiacus muntjak]
MNTKEGVCKPTRGLSGAFLMMIMMSLLNGLMCSKPEDPIEYLESCLQKVKELGGCDKVKWDTFVSQEKKTLPPLNGGQSRRSFLRNVMPENSNFPYRRYDRLPPIHQFSIESDTDLSETAELIEEYEVFDPTRPRPKIILVIGGPGSGKGTQSLKIAERYGFQYISVGELLRKKIHSTSSNRKWSLIAKIITTGELAPQETTITEIKQKLMQMPDEVGIVIDGFPRDVAQALSFEDQVRLLCQEEKITNNRVHDFLFKNENLSILIFIAISQLFSKKPFPSYSPIHGFSSNFSDLEEGKTLGKNQIFPLSLHTLCRLNLLGCLFSGTISDTKSILSCFVCFLILMARFLTFGLDDGDLAKKLIIKQQLGANLNDPKEKSFTQSCPTLCNPMDCNTEVFPVHHQLLELAETHVRRVSDAIQPFNPLSSLLLLPSVFPSIRLFSNQWISLSFSALPFTSLLFLAICKASSDNHFAFLHFSWG